MDLLAAVLEGEERQDEEVLRQVDEELETLQPKRKLSLQQEDVEATILGNFFTVLFAGTDNSSSTISACMSFLATHPEVQGLYLVIPWDFIAFAHDFTRLRYNITKFYRVIIQVVQNLLLTLI